MNERTAPGDWAQWQADWQRAGHLADAAQDASRQIARARRGLLVARLIEGAVAGAAILVTAAALRHAGNRLEAGLGLVVGVGIAALWLQRIRLRAREHAAVAESSPKHLTALTRVRLQQIRALHLDRARPRAGVLDAVVGDREPRAPPDVYRPRLVAVGVAADRRDRGAVRLVVAVASPRARGARGH